MFATLEVYIVCVRKLFIWEGGRGAKKKKKKKNCLSGIEKNKFGYIGEPKTPNNSKPHLWGAKKKISKHDQIC